MISVIIPTYKNIPQLTTNLEINLAYLEGTQVIVVNDYPTESVAESLRGFAVTLIENKTNLGFAGAVNEGVKRAKGSYIMLLNSDVILKDSNYKKALKHFDNNTDLFAVSFAQKEKDGKVVGKNKIFWNRGFIYHSKAPDLQLGISGWAEGGACIIDKKKFEKLGGFDPLYKPFYWEDVDLSYRAKKAGYKVFFDPGILVEHHHESTIGKYFKSDAIKRVAFRNQFIFTWKNITDINLLASHIALFPFNMVYYMFANQWQYPAGFLDAFSKIGLVILHRRAQKKISKLTDNRILNHYHE